jgi:hypothetical protein
MTDLRLIADIMLARLAWIAAEELIVKPWLKRKYDRLDQALGDKLPDIS